MIHKSPDDLNIIATLGFTVYGKIILKWRIAQFCSLPAKFVCFNGHKDNQIEHIGYRVELEEIENALIRLSQVEQAAAVYHRTQTAYGKFVAIVACTSVADDKQILQELGKLIPDYMIPTKIIIMGSLPKNPNGKVDRQQLYAQLG